MKALVVDDSRVMRMIIARALKEKGFDVEQASDGLEAIDVLKDAGEVSVMMIDCNMPEMDGLELVKHIRGDDDNLPMKLIMVTSQTEADRVSDALSFGADEYIMKPFTNEVIFEKLELLGLLQ
jgi:two-component system chemotaxis response regulator CheY